jgi:hypothetical protein
MLPSDLCCFDAHIIPPDDDPQGEQTRLMTEEADATKDEDTPMPPFSSDKDDNDDVNENQIHVIDFQLEELSMEEEEDQTEQQDQTHSKDPSAQLLHWHYRLGHLPFKTIQAMAHQGQLPSSLKSCKVPQCAACLYGKATKRPWRTRATPSKVTPTIVNGPGDCVSVDQLISSTPGLIAQISGWLTRQRYTATTVFVDHYSRLSFVYMQKDTKGSETLQAKKAFEAYAKSHGVNIRHYHADNGRFKEKVWLDHCELKQQSISFCGAHAHFQNSIAEKRIRDLQDSARTMLVHAKHRWPKAINAHLWPYAL